MFAAQAIPQGSFVCQYVGEYVTAAEARRRLAAYDQDTDKGHALLVGRLQCSLGVLLCLLWPVGCFGETGAGGGGSLQGGRAGETGPRCLRDGESGPMHSLSTCSIGQGEADSL